MIFSTEIVSKLESLQTRLLDYAAPILRFLDSFVARTIIFLGAIIYIVNKSVLDIHDSWHTFSGFLFITLTFILLLRPRNAWGFFATLTVISLLNLSPLYWRLQGYDTDGFSLLGILPSSDAEGYFTGAVKILYGEHISPFAARRPLFSTFLSTLLFITSQDLVFSLVILSIVVVVALLILALEVREHLGVLPSAIVTVIMVYCYTGKFAGKFLTEQLGIPLGILALALLLRGLRLQSFRYIGVGIFTLTLALNARAGALFVLPLLILWGAWFPKNQKFSPRNFIILCGVVGLGFFLNFAIFKLLASPGSIPFGNFGATLYGMATGYKGWRAFYIEYPKVSEAEAFKISAQIILKSPILFLTAILKAYVEFLKPSYFFSFLYMPTAQTTPVTYILGPMTLIGLWRLFQNRQFLFARMILFVFLGIVLSVPFAPPADDTIRVMTATTCFLALLAACAFINSKSFQIMDGNAPLKTVTPLLSYFTSAILFLTLAGWLLVRGTWFIPEKVLNCDPGESPITMVITPNSYVNVLKNSQATSSYSPNIRRTELLMNLSNFPNNAIWGALRKVGAENTIMLGLNFANQNRDSGFIWMIAPTSLVQEPYHPTYFCGKHMEWVKPDNFYIESKMENTFSRP